MCFSAAAVINAKLAARRGDKKKCPRVSRDVDTLLGWDRWVHVPVARLEIAVI